MKGRNRFTAHQVAAVRRLLEVKLLSKRGEQKRIRKELRALGFYISDFSSPGHAFGPQDFAVLIKAGAITVAGE